MRRDDRWYQRVGIYAIHRAAPLRQEIGAGSARQDKPKVSSGLTSVSSREINPQTPRLRYATARVSIAFDYLGRPFHVRSADPRPRRRPEDSERNKALGIWGALG